MAQSEQEILEGLAEIVNEETGLDTASVELDKNFTDDLVVWVIFYGPEGGEDNG